MSQCAGNAKPVILKETRFMKTLALNLDEELVATFEIACRAHGHNKSDVASKLVRQFVASEQLREILQRASLKKLYETLATEDVALAELGLVDHQRNLASADQS